MTNRETIREAVEEAVAIAGGQTALAKATGKKHAHVWFWLHRAKTVSPGDAIKIEHATNGKVSRDRLCPELSPEFRP